MSNYTPRTSLKKAMVRQYLKELTGISEWMDGREKGFTNTIIDSADIGVVTGKLELLGCTTEKIEGDITIGTYGAVYACRWVYDMECVAQMTTDGELEILQLY